MFSEDTMVYPKESEWFWELQADDTVRKLEETEFFQSDFIGLKKLMDNGKVQFVEWPGQHLQMTTKEMEETLIPFLMS